VDVLIPAVSQRADAGFARLHRTARLPELICVCDGARFTLPPRAVADAVRGMADLGDVRAVVAEAVQRGRCSVRSSPRSWPSGQSGDLRCCVRRWRR
jgi:hypothetical protein